jgi:hypothetical protein
MSNEPGEMGEPFQDDDITGEVELCACDVGDNSGTESSARILWGLNALNVVACVGMITVQEWARSTHNASSFEYAAPLALAPVVASNAWNGIALSVLAFLLWPASKRDFICRFSRSFVLACIGHSLWSVLWAYDVLLLSALVAVFVCGQLLTICLVLAQAPPLYRLPFSLWFGWAAFGTVSQLSAALYHEAHLVFFGSACWSAAAMLSVSALAYAWGLLADDPFFSAAVAIALFGVSQRHHSLLVVTVAYACCIAVTAHGLVRLMINCAPHRHAEAAATPRADVEDGRAQLRVAPLLSLPTEDSPASRMAAAAAGEARVPSTFYHASYSAYDHLAMGAQAMKSDTANTRP